MSARPPPRAHGGRECQHEDSNTLRLLAILGVPLLLLGGAAAGLLALRSAPGAAHAATSGPPAGLRVRGNQLVDGSGTPLRLIGVNRSGSEYACIQGWGVFDGPSDDASARAMAAWHVNSVRVPLNEDCWLGINGVPAADAGAAYQQAIVAYVNLLHQHGLYAEISLMWSAPGTTKASYQREMPDTDHTPAMWQSVAATFKNDPNVVFGVYGEPHGVDWPCWRDGGTSCGLGWSVAGMQSLVDAVRSTGATQPIAVPGIDYANNLSQWLQYQPTDPLNSLVAEFHEYGDNTCHDAGCWNTQLLAVAQQAPLLTGELGESVNGTCAHSFLDSYMAWADAHGVSYQGWTWDTWGGCGVLITDYAGTPTSGFGQGFQAHLAALGTGGGPLPPGPTPTAQPSPSPSPMPTAQPSPSPSPTPTQPPSGACDTPAISFGPQSASAASVAQGGTISFTTRFTASCATQGLVDFEVFTADGTKNLAEVARQLPAHGAESERQRALEGAREPAGGRLLPLHRRLQPRLGHTLGLEAPGGHLPGDAGRGGLRQHAVDQLHRRGGFPRDDQRRHGHAAECDTPGELRLHRVGGLRGLRRGGQPRLPDLAGPPTVDRAGADLHGELGGAGKPGGGRLSPLTGRLQPSRDRLEHALRLG